MNTPIVFNAFSRKPGILAYLACVLAALALSAGIFRIVTLNEELTRIRADTQRIAQKRSSVADQPASQTAALTDKRLLKAAQLLATPWDKILDQIESSRPDRVAVIDISLNAIERTMLVASRSPNVELAHEFSDALFQQGFKDVKLLSVITSSEGDQKLLRISHSVRWGPTGGS
jgi:hypothetical protein